MAAFSRKMTRVAIIAAVVFLIGTVLLDAGLINEETFVKITEEYSISRFSNENSEIGGGKTRVHFMDMGQSECILITTDDKTMLIDAAEKGCGKRIEAYLDEQGVSKIDIFIVTHPHSDHIGSAVSVFENFEVGEFIMSDIEDEFLPTSLLYENMLEAADKEGCKVTLAKPGMTRKLDEKTNVEILGPVDSCRGNYNNCSIVAKLTCGSTSFLFTGDEEEEAETALLSFGADVSCDVYKAAHHGSKTSNSDALLDAAAPDYAVILCGKDNDYGHPHKTVINAFKERGCEIYRTDTDGSIIFTSDGENLVVKKEK
jgi:competence protein ComEC